MTKNNQKLVTTEELIIKKTKEYLQLFLFVERIFL